MTRQELIQQDFQAKGAVIDAERGYLRSQIALLEAQLKQNTVKAQELEFQWNSYVESIKAQQQAANGEETQAAPAQPKKKPNAVKG